MNRLSPFIRIGLRYFSGYALARGYLDEGTAKMLYMDAEILGIITICISETWYCLAKRFDWVK